MEYNARSYGNLKEVKNVASAFKEFWGTMSQGELLAWCGPWPLGFMCCGCNKQIHRDYRSPVEKKGQHGHSLSEREGQRTRGLTPAWTGFYCFSGYIPLRMVLIYYGQVRYRWLPFTDNKGKNVANYFKEKEVTDQGEKWLNWLHSSKHFLPQSRLKEF